MAAYLEGEGSDLLDHRGLAGEEGLRVGQVVEVVAVVHGRLG